MKARMEKRVNSVYLPLELIIEILLRLPVKTLLRFRCLCKSWLSLISNNNFTTSHFEHAATHRLVLVNDYDHKPHLSIDVEASLHDHSAHASLTLDFLSPPCDTKHRLQIRGSCRGFLCILHKRTNFYLWNPSTGFNKQIPDSPIYYGFELLFGFGYDKSTDDYLIISGFCEDDPDYPAPSSIKLMIFSLRANKWRPIEVASHLPYEETAVYPNCGLFLNGSIHWIDYNYDTLKNVIITFDLREMEMLEISLPDDFILIFRKSKCTHYGLLEVGGLISAWIRNLNTVKIYVMQEYGVHSSWSQIIQFSFDPVLHRYLYIVCITKCGDIVGRNEKGQFVKFNNKGQLLEPHFCTNYRNLGLALYTESLFLLPFSGQT